jgi:hypothetical protein
MKPRALAHSVPQRRAQSHAIYGAASPLSGARSTTSWIPACRAQCAQQKYWPRASMP